MAILAETIPTQGFELVANRIGELLLEEITNQQSIQGFTEEVEVFLERIEPFDKSQDVQITVAYRESIFEGYTQKDVQGLCTYFIDLFVCGQGVGDESPSINAKNKLFRYLGLIRYILSSGKIPTLGFPLGFIGGKYISKITIDTDYSNFGNHSNYDGAFIRFARVIFQVRVQENQELWNGVLLDGNTTKIGYENTSKGIKLVFNN